MLNLEVTKELVFEAPGEHQSVELCGLSYASTDNNEMIASKRICIGSGGHSNWRNWPVKYCLVRSKDNGKTWQEETPYYDVGTGKIQWLPDKKVKEIYEQVEANPERAMNEMASGEEKTEKSKTD